MKKLITTAALALAALAGSAAHAADAGATIHRYLVERTFPAGALAGVDAAAKRKVNENNKTHNVTWVQSYMNREQTKTYCVYTGPSEQAVRDVARLNGLPVDSIVEIPGTLMPY
jgi:outer membrane protein W